LLHVLSASSEFLGHIELRLTVHVPTAYLIPTKAYLMFNELTGNKQWGFDPEGGVTMCKRTPVVMGRKVVDELHVTIGQLIVLLVEGNPGHVSDTKVRTHGIQKLDLNVSYFHISLFVFRT
jgi:hypothetical protein